MTRHILDEVPDLNALITGADVIVDALLGTGTTGKPRAPFDSIIRALNEVPVPVIAVDVPSGLDPDSGVAECAVKVWRTVTMGLPKVGMMTADGPRHCGSVRVEALRFPVDLLDGVETRYESLTFSEAAALLPHRPHDGHKGRFGRLLLFAGSAPMPGAAVLAGLGALRGGCGLVAMHVPDDVRAAIGFHLPEAIQSAASTGGRLLKPLHRDDWEEALNKATAVAIGPGIGTDAITVDLLNQVFDHCKCPVVFDADALNMIAANPQLKGRLAENHVISPHSGELGRLLDATVAEIEGNRWQAATRAADELGCVVLLKGAGTIVATPGGNASHIPSGNSALSRGGAGDVLTGLIGSLLAQGMQPAEAAKLGAFVHGLAADIYVRSRSGRGALVREIADLLPEAFRELEEA